MAERREELLEGALLYVLDHGLGGLSLRPLAAALATSDRMLLYHFGSKDRLVDEVLTAATGALLVGVQAAVTQAEHSRAGLVRALWRTASDPGVAPLVRLWFEVYGLALQQPDRYRPALRDAVLAWQSAVAERLGGDRTAATLLVGGVEGLLLDLLVTGERERVDAAVVELARLVERAG